MNRQHFPTWTPSIVMIAFLLSSIGGISRAPAQSVVSTNPTVALHEKTPNVFALTHARITVAPGRTLDDATLVVRNGRVEAVGPQVPVPPDAVVYDLKGRTVTPGWIDAYAPSILQKDAFKDWKPTHWNARVLPERSVAERPLWDAEQIKKYRSVGFTAALVVPSDGVFRGQSALILLQDGEAHNSILVRDVAQHLAFEYLARFPRRPDEFQQIRYPTSLMGAIALIRQTLYDAQWYAQALAVAQRNPQVPRPQNAPALAVLEAVLQRRQPVILEVSDEWNFLRAARIVQEFGLRAVIKGSGAEYRRVDLIRATGLPVIVPVHFPEAPAVEDPAVALNVSLRDLMHWDLAPENPKRLADAGVTLALTAHGLRRIEDFRNALNRAIRRGLPKDRALAALTTVPAQLLGVADRLGTLEPGKIANFIVSDGDPLDPKTTIQEVWVEGRQYDVKPLPEQEPRGEWRLEVSKGDAPVTRTLVVRGSLDQLQAEIQHDTQKTPARRAAYALDRFTLVVPGEALGDKGLVQMTGVVLGDRMDGTGFWSDGTAFSWQATRTAPYRPEVETAPLRAESSAPPKKPEEAIEDSPATATVVYPFEAYGRPEPVPPQPAYVLVKNATLWTVGPQGTLRNADLLVERGKIKAVGPNLVAPPGAIVIDATGKHVTPGLIDAHSHTAIAGGVNEFGKTITSEVRIQDVIDPDDINIYRQLAGGLTTALLLHGSANPIGGQSQVIKLRWGNDPQNLIFREAPPTIKFALGENVKQSNLPTPSTRYPQSRMGVEQILRDRFKAALDYKRAWEAYLKAKDKTRLVPPRRDLELEALVEILDGKRFIHAHSYRQDEILMLIRLAEDLGFRVQCFQHILEGYKVADALARHGAGASAFSDWWAYKIEVYDAIPFNGALMWSQGVVVSFNSDSDELARRLNWEAAKAVKYGGLPEEEALKFVTLNPAKQLRIDRWVGSLEPGKDADFVIWSGHPFAPDTHAEQTWIDGRRYFDRAEDLKARETVRQLRAQLIEKALKARRERPDLGRPTGPRPVLEIRRSESYHETGVEP
ncbi:MAG: amidohydrolase family protein [Acidobacteria bacterium]|nr:amidohydrolase family protein [Acidobacteriota bacterium]MDW7984943.1 amidohydrolase family protein [Acidobacteriota bacterium]